MQPDAELLAAYAARRDEAAFAEIVSRHGGMVYRACRRLLGDDHEAEDAAQAVFVVLVRKAGNLREGGRLGGWLHGVAGLVCRQAVRERARRARHEKEAGMMRVGNDAEMAVADREALLECVDRELVALPAAERQAVILRYLEDRPQEEAAQIAGCPQGTLAWRASKGLERLRERLARRGTVLGLAAIAGILAAESQAAVPVSLLPSLVSASSLAAACGLATGIVGAQHVAPLHLAEGVMKAMLWAKIKIIAAVVAVAAGTVGVGAPLVYRAVAGENLQSAGVGAGLKPAPTDANAIAWGEAANGLQAGLVPLGGAAKDWFSFSICPKCVAILLRSSLGKCGDCGAVTVSSASKFCEDCAATKRICQGCGAEKPTGNVFFEGEPVRLEIHMKNVGGKDMNLLDAGWCSNWRIEFRPAAGGASLVPHSLVKYERAHLENVLLAKGRHESKIFPFGKEWVFRPRPQSVAKPYDALPIGTYTVTAGYEYNAPQEQTDGLWRGNVSTGAVEIEISAKDGFAWGETVNNLQVGIASMGGSNEKWQKGGFGHDKCYQDAVNTRTVARGKCLDCKGKAFDKAVLCHKCALSQRVCMVCKQPKPSGMTFTEGDPVLLELAFKIRDSAEHKFLDSSPERSTLRLSFVSKEGVIRTARYIPRGSFQLLVAADRMRCSTPLDAEWRFEGITSNPAGKEFDAHLLPPGKYTVTVAYERSSGLDADKSNCWNGKVVSGPVMIEVKPEGAEGPGDIKHGSDEQERAKAFALEASRLTLCMEPSVVDVKVEAYNQEDAAVLAKVWPGVNFFRLNRGGTVAVTAGAVDVLLLDKGSADRFMGENLPFPETQVEADFIGRLATIFWGCQTLGNLPSATRKDDGWYQYTTSTNPRFQVWIKPPGVGKKGCLIRSRFYHMPSP